MTTWAPGPFHLTEWPNESSPTLAKWAENQPYTLNLHTSGAFWIPDSERLIDRTGAWSLSDYRVSSVSGGTIWFTKR